MNKKLRGMKSPGQVPFSIQGTSGAMPSSRKVPQKIMRSVTGKRK